MDAIAYGIDLSGRSRDGCRVVRAERANDGSISAQLIQSVLCNNELSPKDLIKEFYDEVQSWGRQATVVVDVPIDLQSLGRSPDKKRIDHYWQLTLRPIDRALGALAALADRIGATVALWQLISPFAGEELGRRLFESYPAGSLRAAGLPHKNYKIVRSGERKLSASAKMNKGVWILANHTDAQSHPLPAILQSLGISAPEGAMVTHDDVDALICALAGLPGDHVLEGDALSFWARSVPSWKSDAPIDLPKGYRLIRGRLGGEIKLMRSSCSG